MNNNTQKPLFAMILRSLRPRANMSSPSTRFLLSSQQPRRTLIPPPSEKAGPLMERRSDRELPPLPNLNRWFKTFPIFVAIMIGSTLAIFNYEKSTSSIVSATLYALRTSDTGREVLGENIYFRDRFPWIWGKINQLHGNIDIRFAVKGTKGEGMMRFRSIRRTRMGYVSCALLLWQSSLSHFQNYFLWNPNGSVRTFTNMY